MAGHFPGVQKCGQDVWQAWTVFQVSCINLAATGGATGVTAVLAVFAGIGPTKKVALSAVGSALETGGEAFLKKN